MSSNSAFACSTSSEGVSVVTLADSRLGGSGSGKTTLLNAVAHRLSGLPVEDGHVSYFPAIQGGQGIELSKGEVKRRIGFVRQQDFLLECLTGMCLVYFNSNQRHIILLKLRGAPKIACIVILGLCS
jgi:ABC-type cobalamin/Fe3+-siderophores transport system ATPase subunit